MRRSPSIRSSYPEDRQWHLSTLRHRVGLRDQPNVPIRPSRVYWVIISVVWRACAVALLSGAWPSPGFADEEILNLDTLRGRVVYVDFWASWCAPCRESFPWMQQMQQRYRAEGLEVVAVDLDRSRADADRFLRAYPTQLRLVFDPGGALATRFNVQGMPMSLLIDRHGTARFTHIGFLPNDRAVYESEIRTLVSER
jgi:cytochrome c biogenesis protein CcmG/thiol:disulfide interchange protein DsbE